MTEVILGSYSYAGLIILLALTGCGLPVPEEAIIVLAGVLSGAGVFSPFVAFPACMLGVFLGDAMMYTAGYHGQRWLAGWCMRLRLENKRAVWNRAGALLSSHPGQAMLLSHLSLGIRPFVYFAIGAAHARVGHFLLAELICVSTITSICFWLAYIGGNAASAWLRPTGMVLTLIIFLAVLLIIRLRLRRRSQAITATGAPAVDSWAQETESRPITPRQGAKSDYDL